MFTGIIQEVGRLQAMTPSGEGMHLEIGCSKILSEINMGDSVSCNGVCLTATHMGSKSFNAFAVRETLSKSNLSNVKPGASINLELAAKLETRLGGHLVSGHIDATASVEAITKLADGSWEFSVDIPQDLSRYCIPKGSIALNGISLTIAHIKLNRITVSLIPHTLKETNLCGVNIGYSLNVEVDLVGKYLERLAQPYGVGQSSLSHAQLKDWGY